MKKLTLTFCAFIALLVVAPAIYADGPEKYSGKEKEVMQPAPPVCDFYRAHEWDLSIWGAWAFGAVVVLTLLAARTFDERLLWDAPRHD